jgi:hypothetical protein
VRKIYKRGTVLGALAGAMLLAGAQGAMAQTESPEGIGIEASGVLAITPAPVADSATPNPGSVAAVPIAPLLTANVVSAQVSGNTTTAGVASLTALGGTGISAGAISSSCTANSDGSFTETSNLANLVIPGLTIPVNPGPNTGLTLTGVLSIVLNQQVAGPASVPGSRTVNALVITTPVETITIGSSTCGPYVAGAPIAGGKGLALGGGAVAAAGAGIAAVKLNRRRRPNGA